jgi:hypothetical protein
MVDIVRTKRSTTASAVPVAGTLPDGQLAVNSADKKIYIGDSSNDPILIYDPANLPTHVLSFHDDVSASTPGASAVLTWSGSIWEPQQPTGGLVEYGAVVTDDAGDGTVEGDANATDWTGHTYADGDPVTAINILSNHSVTFAHKGVSYKWVGPKDVYVGLGGSTTTSDDYLQQGIGDHTLLSNIGTNTHTQIDTHLGLVAGNPHQVTWTEVLSKPSTFPAAPHTVESHSDVTLSSIVDGELLRWNGSIWINNTLAEAGIALEVHNHDGDYDVLGAAATVQGNLDSHTGTITGNPHAVSVTDLSDTTLTAIATGEILKWTGSAWINNTLAEASIASITHAHDGVDANVIDCGTFP